MTSHDRRKITTTEMKCLRRILGVTRRDRIRNEDIRKRVGTTPILNIEHTSRDNRLSGLVTSAECHQTANDKWQCYKDTTATKQGDDHVKDGPLK
jgi:hypothetical protein